MKVTIIKGEHKGTKAIVTQTQKEEIGEGVLYQLKNTSGQKLWNGSYANFPEDFILYNH